MGEQCSSCGVPVAGASILYTPDGRIVCPACFGRVAMPADVGKPQWKIFAGAGAVAGMIPFGVHMSTSSSSTVNGHVTAFIYRDWIAVVCGVVAIMLGAIATAAARKEQLQRSLAFAAGIGVVLLGAVQVARGFGVFEAPGSSADSSSSMTFESSTPSPPEPLVDPNDPKVCPDAHECFQLGLKLEKTDAPGATIAYERACDFGANGGCLNAAIDYRENEPKNLAKSAALFKRGCDMKQWAACNEYGSALRHGRGIEKDVAAAKAMFETACNNGDKLGCTNLAFLYEYGEGVDKDLAKATEMTVKICESGEDPDTAAACDEAGALVYQTGKKADLPRAANYMKLACDRAAHHCKNYGVILTTGEGVKKDDALARQIEERGCDGGEPEACHSLGFLRSSGTGGPKDIEGAKAAYQKGCDGGFEKSCAAIQEMNDEAEAPAAPTKKTSSKKTTKKHHK